MAGLFEEQGRQPDATRLEHGTQCRMRKVLMQGLRCDMIRIEWCGNLHSKTNVADRKMHDCCVDHLSLD
jgi:hypothetical protein